jgi:hypothetical protein
MGAERRAEVQVVQDCRRAAAGRGPPPNGSHRRGPSASASPRAYHGPLGSQQDAGADERSAGSDARGRQVTHERRRDDRGAGREERHGRRVFPELERVEQERVRRHDDPGENSPRGVWHQMPPRGCQQRHEGHEGEGGQHVGAAHAERGDQRRGERRKERRLQGVGVAAVYDHHLIDERDRLPADAGKLHFERPAGMVDRFEGGDQLQP